MFYTQGQTEGYGDMLGVLHLGGGSSWYAHFDSDSSPWAEYYAQGDLAGYADRIGFASGCHLHFQVNDSTAAPHQTGFQTVDICMAAATCGQYGFDLQHLSDQPWTTHPSNNTGPGYGRPGAPAGLDPGSEIEPLSEPINTTVRYFVSQGLEVGSTLASNQGPCGANRHWVKELRLRGNHRLLTELPLTTFHGRLVSAQCHGRA